jgi:hypothetical protein
LEFVISTLIKIHLKNELETKLNELESKIIWLKKQIFF